MLYTMKKALGRTLFRLTGVDRIHIVGCARSGTTLMQYAMVAFDGVSVANHEASLAYPDLAERFRLAGEAVRNRPVVLITKRTYGWFEAEAVCEVVRAARRDGIGVILVVRDPRAVLTSKHGGLSESGAYVDQDRWHKSVLAGDQIWEQLGEYPRKLIVKYEDLVTKPDAVERDLSVSFGLRRRSDMLPLANVKSNLERSGYVVDSHMDEAMHGLRDIDTSRPARAVPPLCDLDIDRASINAAIMEFMGRYGYRQ